METYKIVDRSLIGRGEVKFTFDVEADNKELALVRAGVMIGRWLEGEQDVDEVRAIRWPPDDGT